MSKHNSLDKYFNKRKEVDEENTSCNKQCIHNENIITEPNTASKQPNHIITNISSTNGLQFIDNSSATSKTLIYTQFINKNFE